MLVQETIFIELGGEEASEMRTGFLNGAGGGEG